jgi:hypothetical protein
MKATRRTTRTIPARFLPGFLRAIDRRFAAGAAALRIHAELCEALGGADRLSPQRLMVVERAVWLHLTLQQAEQQFALSGKPMNTSSYSQNVHALLSVLGKLGLDRVAKRAPTLAEVIAKNEGGPA